MYKQFIIYSVAFALSLGCLYSQNKEMKITLEQAAQLIRNDNKSIKIADQELEWAKNERQRMNSFWYPQISTTGAYVHMANDIEVKESLSKFTDPAVDWIHSIDPGEQVISSVLNTIGKSSFSVPLLPQNTTTVDAIATLPVFTGGKRIYAGKIGKLMVDAAQISRQKVDADQQILLVQTYYGVRLGQRIVEVKSDTYKALELHFQNALKLEANGMINKAERLFFQVNRDEAKRELEVAIKDLQLAQNAFKILVRIESDSTILPVSSLFINQSLPDISYFKAQVAHNNYLVNGLEVQQNIQQNQIKIAKSAYVPNIELFARQNLYSHGIPKNLFPRTMVGVGFSWNIFDGLNREKSIRQAKINKYITDIEREKVIDDLTLAIDNFYNQTQIALDNVTALKTTVEMSRELVRTRKKAFAEGMATSTEVIDAELLLSKTRIAILLAYYQFDSGLINLLSVCGTPDSFYQYSRNGEDENYILSE